MESEKGAERGEGEGGREEERCREGSGEEEGAGEGEGGRSGEEERMPHDTQGGGSESGEGVRNRVECRVVSARNSVSQFV